MPRFGTILFSFLLVFPTTSAFAAEGLVSLRAELQDTISTYEPSADGVYELVDFKGKVQALMLGAGIFEELQKLHEVDLSGDLPEKDIGEIDQVRVSKQEGNLVVLKIHSVEVIDEDEKFETDAEVEYEISKGSWKDYERGKAIRLRLTEKGSQQEREINQKTGQQLADALFGQLRQLVPKDSVTKTEVKVDNSNDEVVLSKKQIIMRVKQTRLNALLKILIPEPDEPIVRATL